jgi:hypothetical protein
MPNLFIPILISLSPIVKHLLTYRPEGFLFFLMRFPAAEQAGSPSQKAKTPPQIAPSENKE